MEGQLRHLLDGSAIADEPGGWQDFTEDIERNKEERIIHLKYPNTLLFVGDGYAYLRDRFRDASCNEVSYELQQLDGGGWQTICAGVILLTDITWNLSKGTADTPITDVAVGARILNNKQVTTFAEATLSKSGVEIDAVTPIALEVFDPAAAEGTYIGTTRLAYDWKACMAHMVAFITDGEVGFASSWYDDLPDDERFCLLNGLNMRNGSVEARPPEYSFKDLWQFAWRSDNLLAGIEQGSNGPVFRVEREEYWYGNPSSVFHLNQEDLAQSINTDALYAGVRMGSEAAIKNEAIAAAYSLPYVGLRTFSEENYALVGQCNTDNVLDLTLPFIVCTNAIEDAVANNNNDNDEGVFVVQYDRTTSKAVKRDYLTSNGVPYLYNERFLNLNVVRRWRLPASGVSYYADQDAAFRAERTVAGSSYDDTLQGEIGVTQVDARFQFDNDYTPPNFDPDNNWGNGTTQGTPVSNANSRYTAPIRGLYSFEVGQVVSVTNFDQPTGIPYTFFRQLYIIPTVIIKHFNSADTLIDSFTFTTAQPGQSWGAGDWLPLNAIGHYLNTCTQEVYMQQDDYIEVWFKGETWIQAAVGNARAPFQSIQQPYPIGSSGFPINYCRYVFGQGSYVRTVYVATFGGEVITATPDEYYSTKLEYTRHIDNASWGELSTNFDRSIGVSPSETGLLRGYIRTASRKVATGETDWELISNRINAPV